MGKWARRVPSKARKKIALWKRCLNPRLLVVIKSFFTCKPCLQNRDTAPSRSGGSKRTASENEETTSKKTDRGAEVNTHGGGNGTSGWKEQGRKDEPTDQA